MAIKKHKFELEEENMKILEDIISYLNEKADKKFEINKTNWNCINNCLKKGFEVEDLKKVVDFKVEQWKNTNFEMYIRPTTLFGFKIEKYLEETKLKNDIRLNNYTQIKSLSLKDIVKYIKCPRTINETLTEERCEIYESCEKCTSAWLYGDDLLKEGE